MILLVEVVILTLTISLMSAYGLSPHPQYDQYEERPVSQDT